MKLKAALFNPSFWPWLIITMGIILRCWDLTSSPLWYDESFTRLVVGLPLPQLMEATRGDVHPPAYYLIIHGLVSIAGNSALVLRGFSVACSVLALVAVWRLSADMGLPHGPRLIGLALMAFHPMQVYYAQEARMYAWLQLLVLVQLLALFQRDWLRLALTTLLALYSHNYALFYTALIGLVGLARELRRPRDMYRPGIDGELTGTGIPHLVCSIVIPGVLWLPWLAVLIGQMQTITGAYWIQPLTVGSVLLALVEILAGFNVPDSFLPWTAFSLVAGLVLLAISGMQHKKFTLLMISFGPLALAVIGSILFRPILLFRGLLPSLPALALLAGVCIARADRRGRLVALAMVAPLVLVLGWQIGANDQGRVKAVPDFQAINQGPVVHLDDSTLVLNQSIERDHLLDADCPAQGGALSEQTRAALGVRTVKLSDLPEKFFFAGMLTPLSTRCHEEIYHQLTAGSTAIFSESHELGEWGMWYAEY